MTRVAVAVSCMLALLLGMGAGAHGDGRREEARRLVEKSAREYHDGRYLEAAELLQRAYELTPAPVLLFNLGRALDKAGDGARAIVAYRRYLDAAPAAGDREMVAARIAELERLASGKHEQPSAGEHEQPSAGEHEQPSDSAPHEITSRPVARVEPAAATIAAANSPRPPRLRLAAELLLGGTLAVGLVGAVVYGTTYSEYVSHRGDCKVQCPSTSFRDEVRAKEVASGVLLGIAGAALVADIVLWAVDARHRKLARVDAARGMVRF
jgi:tetratricopeptide (TPR) repeat protein